MVSQFSMQQVRATYKVRDSWWTVLLVDPIVGRVVRAAAGRPRVTPDRLTAASFLSGLAAAAAFLAGSPGWLVAGAIVYHLSFVIDCTDGKLARLTGSGSVFGGWLDFFLDRLRVMVCAVALFTGQFFATGHSGFLFAAIGFVFLALFGYVNGAETDKGWAKLAQRGHSRRDDMAALSGAAALLGGVLARVRAVLHRRRIRMNLVSGIEFEMAVLVLAPLLVAATEPAALLWVTGVAAGLLVLFELALIARFWLATRVSARPFLAPQPGPAGPEATTGSADPGEPLQPRRG